MAATPRPTAEATRLLRSPTVSATQIAFAYANNIWVVERAGGAARRLTSFQGQTTNPQFSPDGKWIAFSGEYAGNTDVYVVPGRGRRAEAPDVASRRATSCRAGRPTASGHVRVGARDAGRRAARRASGPCRSRAASRSRCRCRARYQGKISPDGTHIAYRMNNSWDEERRNYRGGQNRPIWIVDLKTYDLVSPPWTDSKDMDPGVVGRHACTSSPIATASSNVWSYDTERRSSRRSRSSPTSTSRRSTPAPARSCSSRPGYIHELDPKTGSDAASCNITATRRLPVDDAAVGGRHEPHDEHRALADRQARRRRGARRDLHDPGREGRRAQPHATRAARPSASRRGRRTASRSRTSATSRASTSSYIESQDGLTPPREIALPKPTHYYTPSWSPDSKKLLYHDTNLNVWVLDVASGQAKSRRHAIRGWCRSAR